MPAKSATTMNDTQDGRGKRRPGVEEQREIIHQAAVSLFATSGTRSVSIGDICKQADVSRPTFYRCYEDKSALIASIYAEAVSNPAEGILLQGDLRQPKQLKNTLDELFENIFNNADLARLVFMEASDPGSPAANIIEKGFEHSARVLARDLRKAGQDVPSPVYLKSLMAAIQWIVYDAIKKDLTTKAKKEAKSAAFELIMSALSPTPQKSGNRK
jgi:AcrR family transcriptional regulator